MSADKKGWRDMTVEERVDHLRIKLIAQEALMAVVIRSLRIDFVMPDPAAESDRPDE